MLLRFSVQNYRSFRDRQEISLIASAVKGFPDAIADEGDLGFGVLRALALYGANASGKTNLFRALSFMGGAVVGSQRHWAPEGGVPVEPFLLDEGSAQEASVFEVDLLLERTRYTYGFKLDSARVVSEWLYAYPNGKRQRWFERQITEDPTFRFGKNLIGENRAIQNLTRSNSLFLSAAAQNGHQQLLPIYKWFSTSLEVVSTAARQSLWMTTAKQYEEAEHKADLLKLLSAADLGIVDVEVTEEELDKKLQTALRSLLSSFSDSEGSAPEGMRIPPMPRIRLRHEAATGRHSVPLPFEDESEGTRMLFAMSGPILRVLRTGGVLCVDELDASLHSKLALGLVRTFNRAETNPRNAQLVFNTHDTNLLDAKILRRDQIWFAEKGTDGASRLYPLSDFQPRKDENLERGYLQGRYGAVPYIGDLFEVGISDGE